MPFVKSRTSQVADDPGFEAPESKKKIPSYNEQRKQIKLEQQFAQNTAQTTRGFRVKGRYILRLINLMISVF